MKTTLVKPVAVQPVVEDHTARNWEFHESNSVLFGDRPPVTLHRGLGEVPPRVGIYCHAPFSTTRLGCDQTGPLARAQVRRYIQRMGHLALAQMNANQSEGVTDSTSSNLATSSSSSSADLTLVGVVLQMQDPDAMGEQLQLPWEFHRIDNLDDESELEQAYKALAALRLSGSDSGISAATSAAAVVAAKAQKHAAGEDDEDDDNGPLFQINPHRLSLYLRLVPRFTGVYPACVVCVRGTPFKRDREGRVTAVMVRQIFTPQRPQYPWGATPSPAAVPRPLVSVKGRGSNIGARVQFCTGPFPRKELYRIATALVRQATVRGVTVVIVGGPFVPPYRDEERMILLNYNMTFSDQLDMFASTIEEELAAQRNTTTRFVMVPSVDDSVSFPIVPQPCFALQVGDAPLNKDDDNDDDEQDGGGYDDDGVIDAVKSVQIASNPCEVVLRAASGGGSVDETAAASCVRFGVTTFDSVSLIREEMAERFPDGSGNSLHRVAETVLASRLYVPLVSCPSPNHDLAHLEKVAIERRTPAIDPSITSGAADEAPPNSTEATPPSYPPHVLFMPSIRPPFAFTSHTSDQDLSDPRGRGSLLINQGAWNTRQTGTKFSVKVAEVTIPDLKSVALAGASIENGVSVGTIEIYDSDV